MLGTLIDDFSASYGVSFAPIAIEKCLVTLEEAASDRVRIFRADLEAAQGRLSLTTPFEEKSVKDLLLDFIAPHVSASSKEELRAAIGSAIKDAASNAIVAYWIRENVITRLHFWRTGTDFLFIWHTTGSSYQIIEGILDLLATIASQLSRPDTEGIWRELLSISPGELILPGILAGRLSLERDTLRHVLVKATDAGLLTPVYRLRTSEALVETVNEWIPAVSQLNRIFTTESGESIDGTDPESIEVAFRRNGEVIPG